MTQLPQTVQNALAQLLQLDPTTASLQDVENIANSLTAAGNGQPGGLIFSGPVGSFSSTDVAKNIASNVPGLNIINDTDRGIFLGQDQVFQTISQIVAG